MYDTIVQYIGITWYIIPLLWVQMCDFEQFHVQGIMQIFHFTALEFHWVSEKNIRSQNKTHQKPPSYTWFCVRIMKHWTFHIVLMQNHKLIPGLLESFGFFLDLLTEPRVHLVFITEQNASPVSHDLWLLPPLFRDQICIFFTVCNIFWFGEKSNTLHQERMAIQ